jgi:hypothetical protein
MGFAALNPSYEAFLHTLLRGLWFAGVYLRFPGYVTSECQTPAAAHWTRSVRLNRNPRDKGHPGTWRPTARTRRLEAHH